MKHLSKILILLLTLVLSISCVSCDQIPGNKKNETNGEPYTLSYVSNGDGTCYVSEIKTNPDYKEFFVVEIPEKSPDGDTVTAVKAKPFLESIPKVLLPEDFEKISNTLKEKVEAGELSEFNYKKLTEGYYWCYSPENIENPEKKAEVLKKYPITEYTDIYVFSEDASQAESNWALSILFRYANYTASDWLRARENLIGFLDTISDADKRNECASIIPSLDGSSYQGEYISEIRFSENVTEIDLPIYQSCINLEKIVFPANVTEIDRFAFSYRYRLNTIQFLGATKVLHEGAFMNCEQLTTVELPKELTTLGDVVFQFCPALKVLHYKGTVEEWNAIEKNLTEKGNSFDTIVCSDGEVNLK